MYWTIYLLYVGYIAYYTYLYIILLQILTNVIFFNIFLSFFHFPTTFPNLRLKPTRKTIKPTGSRF
jgi:hypothetical protein